MAISWCKWLIPVVCYFSFSYSVHSSDFNLNRNHPFYVSVTEIVHNTKDKILEVSCKMFTNDFETSLEKFSHLKIDLSDPKAKSISDKYVAEYISKHLQISVDGKLAVLQWVGSEKESEATWSYFQINNVNGVKKIDVTNSLLYESFSSEINIMHVSVNGNRKSTKLNNPDTEASFVF